MHQLKKKSHAIALSLCSTGTAASDRLAPTAARGGFIGDVEALEVFGDVTVRPPVSNTRLITCERKDKRRRTQCWESQSKPQFPLH